MTNPSEHRARNLSSSSRRSSVENANLMGSDEHWKKNIQCVLRAIGAFEPPIVEEVAAALYKSFMYEDC
jgi:hypothetical protein